MFLLFYYQTWILQRVNQALRLELQDRLQRLSLRFHLDNQVGDAIYRIYQDSAMVTQLIDVLVLTPLFATVRFAFLMFLVALFDPWLALGIVLVAFLRRSITGAYFSQRLRVGFRASREANEPTHLDASRRPSPASRSSRPTRPSTFANNCASRQSSLDAFGAALAARSQTRRLRCHRSSGQVGIALLASTAIATFCCP